jgi:hypothetical protein
MESASSIPVEQIGGTWATGRARETADAGGAQEVANTAQKPRKHLMCLDDSIRELIAFLATRF